MESAEAKRRVFWICCVFLLFFRAKWAFEPSWSSDEGCYLEHLYRWIGATAPQGCTAQPNPVAIGAPVLWFIPALVGRVIASLSGGQVDEWVLPLVALTSMALWGVGFAFVDGVLKTLRGSEVIPVRRRPLWVLAFTFSVPVLYYGVHRAMMAHTAEFALAMAVLYFLRSGRPKSALGCALGLALTRYNDAPAVLMALAGFLGPSGDRVASRVPRWVIPAGVAAVVFFAWLALFHGYSTYTAVDLFSAYTWDGVTGALVGQDFGLLWTAVPWLISLVLGLLYFARLSWVGRAAALWLLAEAFLVGGWNGNGSDFGYRYLIGSYAASFWVWLEVFECGMFSSRVGALAASAFRFLIATQAVFLTALLVAFKTVPGTGMGDLQNSRVSQVLWNLVTAPWIPKFFKVVLIQQFPPVTVFLSLAMSQRPGYAYYSVHGPGLALLSATTLGCLGWVIWRFFSDGFTC